MPARQPLSLHHNALTNVQDKKVITIKDDQGVQDANSNVLHYITCQKYFVTLLDILSYSQVSESILQKVYNH